MVFKSFSIMSQKIILFVFFVFSKPLNLKLIENTNMNPEIKDSEAWLFEITPQKRWFVIPFKELWRYRDLLLLFVHRDLTTVYKQTILGPLWYFIQPLLTALVFTFLFNRLAGVETGDTPALLFNLAGITVWNYFSNCLMETSDTFQKNVHLFGKVYFPRLISPLTVVITNLVKMLIQLALFFGFYLYFIAKGMPNQIGLKTLWLPLVIINMGLLGFALGLIVSSLVAKYRDFSFLVSFGTQLLMFSSAVMYPLSLIRKKIPQYSWFIDYNPLANLIETTRILLLNEGSIHIYNLLYTGIITLLLLLLGLLLFHRTEKNFIDSI